VAGNIGAKAVQAAAGALEKLIRAKAATAEVDPAKLQVAAALDPLLAQLQAALRPPESETPAQASPPPVASPAQSREAAGQMTKLLSEFDPGAVDFTEANQAALSPLFPGEGWAQFEKLVQNYAFAEAQAQLDKALKHLPPV
jgi:HPt (histidine-containing phosphotransfer) domain-containing protein